MDSNRAHTEAPPPLQWPPVQSRIREQEDKHYALKGILGAAQALDHRSRAGCSPQAYKPIREVQQLHRTNFVRSVGDEVRRDEISVRQIVPSQVRDSLADRPVKFLTRKQASW